MSKKALIIGTVVLLAIVLGGTYFYAGGDMLQGRFGGGKLGTPAKPDLEVTSVSLEEDIIYATIENTGKKDVTDKSGHTFVYVDDLTTPVRTYSWSTLGDTNFLTAGGSSILEYPGLEPGTYDVMVCVDATKKIVEKDEGNNCLSEAIEVAEEDVAEDEVIEEVVESTADYDGDLVIGWSGDVISETYAAGEEDVNLLGISFFCNSDEDCLVSDLSLLAYIDEDGVGGFLDGSDNGVYANDVVSSVWLLNGSTTSDAESVSSAGAVNFSNLNWTVAAGEWETFYLKGDISRSAYYNSNEEDVAFEITEDDVTAESPDGNSLALTGGANAGLPGRADVYITTSP